MKICMVLALIVLCASACGVRDERDASPLDSAALPPEHVTTESGLPSEGANDQTEPATLLFLLRAEQLVEVRRPESPSLGEAIRLLVAGATDEEASSGLRSAIPTATQLRRATVADGTALIDLDETFIGVVGPEQILAVAQLVFTATAIAGIERVAIAIDGDVVDIPTGDGRLAARPVSRDDYRDVAPS